MDVKEDGIALMLPTGKMALPPQIKKERRGEVVELCLPKSWGHATGREQPGRVKLGSEFFLTKDCSLTVG